MGAVKACGQSSQKTNWRSFQISYHFIRNMETNCLIPLWLGMSARYTIGLWKQKKHRSSRRLLWKMYWANLKKNAPQKRLRQQFSGSGRVSCSMSIFQRVKRSIEDLMVKTTSVQNRKLYLNIKKQTPTFSLHPRNAASNRQLLFHHEGGACQSLAASLGCS